MVEDPEEEEDLVASEVLFVAVLDLNRRSPQLLGMAIFNRA